MIGTVSGLKPLNRSMFLNRNFFFKISFLILLVQRAVFSEEVFEIDADRSSILQNIISSDIGIADLNNDGVNDIILSGYNKIGNQEGLFLNTYSISSTGVIDTLQMNLLSNYFTYIPENHSSKYIGGDGGLSLGDYDRDGLIDVLIHGAEFMLLTRNLGGNLSTNNYMPGDFSESLGESSLQWGDVDNDGDLDLFWMGLKNGRTTITNKLLLNQIDFEGNTNWAFDNSIVMPDLRNGALAWEDIDLDGDLDLLTSGQQLTVESGVTKLYLNDPLGRLGEDTNQEIAALKGTAICFSDLDNDTDSDLIISGYSPIDSSLKTLIYINEPTGNFRLADEQINFGTIFGSIKAIDINMDGFKDIAISGAVQHSINYDSIYLIDTLQMSEQGDVLEADTTVLLLNPRDSVWALEGKIFLNSGNGELEFNDIQTIEGARTISFVDVNQDKKPDIIASGTTEVGDSDSSFVSVLLNVSVGSNNKPTPPTILESFAISNRAIFNWGAGSDDIAPAQTLHYNLSIARVLDGNETKALIPEIVAYNNSNVGTRLIREFTNIPWGNYNWKVQTIDPSGVISDWSEEKELFIPRLVKSFQSIPGYSYGISRWSDINDDELLDLAITGNLYTGSSKTQIYLNDDEILNVDNLQPRMANVYGGHLSFVDYNNDGFLDISMTGIATINFSTFTALLLYKYENGNFMLDEQENQLSASSGYWGGQYNHDWGDYDNDGDLDLVSGGISIFDNTNYLNVFNNSNGLLSIDTTQTDLVPLFPSAVVWIDINRDNHLDLLALGRLGSDGISHMYINDSTGNLTLSSEQPFSIPSTLHAISVGDYNNDSFDDIAVAHLDGSNMHTNIYTNENGTRFTLQQELEGATYSSLDWGDYDNDGDLDLVSSGYTGTLITDLGQTEYINPITNIYQQNENGQFILDSSLYMLDSVGLSSTQWGDYDNDGDLDLLVTGETEEKELITRVYENLEGFTNPNNKPTKPIMLLSDVNIDSVYISWQGGIDTDNQSGSGRTSDIALKYQLQMGEDQNYSLAGNTHSIISGKYGTGRMGSRSGTNHVINSLPEGRYQWRVRSIDHSLGSSEWSNWDYYYIDQTPPEVDTIQVNYGVGGQIIIIVNFKEEFEMNNSSEAEPFIYAVHPDMNDIDGDQISDTLVVVKQSYSATVWTGLLSLPDNYIGKSIKLHISNAKDMRGNIMKHSVYFKTPQKIISQAGGSVISSDGNVSILFPQNAVNEDVSISINPLIEIAAIDTNLISNFYTISPSDLELKKPTIIRIAVPANEIDGSQENQNLHIGRLNTITGEKTTIGGSIISVNGTPYLQSQLSQLGVFAAFKSDSTISVDSLKTDKIICQPRIFSPAGSVFEFPHTNILFDLPSSDNVTARIFNVSGKIKRTLKPEQKLGPGSNVIIWDGKDFDGSVVPSGLYIVTLESSESIFRTTVGVLNR